VTRKIYDFSPEQLANLTAIVWLYRGQTERFLDLVRGYFGKVCDEIGLVPAELTAFDHTLLELRDQLHIFAGSIGRFDKVLANAANLGVRDVDQSPTGIYEVLGGGSLVSEDKLQPFTDALTELAEAHAAYETDRDSLLSELDSFGRVTAEATPETNADQHAARQGFDLLAERVKGLVKQVDLLYKLAARAGQLAYDLAGEEAAAEFHDRRAASRCIKQLDEERKAAVEQLKLAVYFHRQIHWLQDRFPDAQFAAVPGLCKAVTRAEIEAAD
jgi:type I restriction enzyme M protein